MFQVNFISQYVECLYLLDEIEELFLWQQLWIDLDLANEFWSMGLEG